MAQKDKYVRELKPYGKADSTREFSHHQLKSLRIKNSGTVTVTINNCWDIAPGTTETFGTSNNLNIDTTVYKWSWPSTAANNDCTIVLDIELWEN